MSTDVFSILRQTTEQKLAQATSELTAHRDEWEEVLDWMEDAPSRRAYAKELAFQGACALFGQETAMQCINAMPPHAWDRACAQLQLAREQGTLPHIETDLPEPEKTRRENIIFLTTFQCRQYAYDGQVTLRPGEVMLDCGACYGETALWGRMEGAGTVYCFEPSPSSLAVMHKNAARFDPEGQWLRPVPLAVSNAEETLHFQENGDQPGASRLCQSGGLEVQATSLDYWCAENGVAPNFIKMDLEGAEGLALLGAEQVLREYTPRLAVCLYHQLDHMWMLPRAIKAMVPQYRFWCKKAAPWGEFVLFARAD